MSMINMSMNQQEILPNQSAKSVEERLAAEPRADLKKLLNDKLMLCELADENYDEIRDELIEELNKKKESEQ